MFAFDFVRLVNAVGGVDICALRTQNCWMPIGPVSDKPRGHGDTAQTDATLPNFIPRGFARRKTSWDRLRWIRSKGSCAFNVKSQMPVDAPCAGTPRPNVVICVSNCRKRPSSHQTEFPRFRVIAGGRRFLLKCASRVVCRVSDLCWVTALTVYFAQRLLRISCEGVFHSIPPSALTLGLYWVSAETSNLGANFGQRRGIRNIYQTTPSQCSTAFSIPPTTTPPLFLSILALAERVESGGAGGQPSCLGPRRRLERIPGVSRVLSRLRVKCNPRPFGTPSVSIRSLLLSTREVALLWQRNNFPGSFASPDAASSPAHIKAE